MIGFFIALMVLFSTVHAQLIKVQQNKISDYHYEINVHFDLKPDQWLYKDFLQFSLDHPSAKITHVQSTQDPILQYDPAFKETKKVYNKPITFQLSIDDETREPIEDATLHVTYQLNKEKHPEHTIIPLTTATHENHESMQEEKTQASLPAALPIQSESPSSSATDEKKAEPAKSLADYVEGLLTTTHSLWFRLLLVFLLGLLFSLTPCIYPMIPITIGILQSKGSKSLVHNFLLALLYTTGMAITYALFGLFASCVGPLCGKLLINPFFVVGLVILLTYLALSMFGFYEMYIPKALQKNYQPKNSSLIAIFLWGVASGTFASPCVSPGLALVLTIVATIGNQFIGFLILFFFGIGLSIPLLIIGTFSSSLVLLPKAGLWMVEIKRLLGFMILGMAFYYLSYIVPLNRLFILMALTMIGLGIFYILLSAKMKASIWKYINQIIGILLIAGSFLVAYKGYKESIKLEMDDSSWNINWENSIHQAQEQHKKIFIDFWATFCTTCIAINKTVLNDPQIQNALNHYILLKVDGTSESNIPYQQLKDKFAIIGFPVLLIYDPTIDKVLKQWGAEVYTMDRDAFKKELQSYK